MGTNMKGYKLDTIIHVLETCEDRADECMEALNNFNAISVIDRLLERLNCRVTNAIYEDSEEKRRILGKRADMLLSAAHDALARLTCK